MFILDKNPPNNPSIHCLLPPLIHVSLNKSHLWHLCIYSHYSGDNLAAYSVIFFTLMTLCTLRKETFGTKLQYNTILHSFPELYERDCFKAVSFLFTMLKPYVSITSPSGDICKSRRKLYICHNSKEYLYRPIFFEADIEWPIYWSGPTSHSRIMWMQPIK